MEQDAPAIIAAICLFTGGVIWLLLRLSRGLWDDESQDNDSPPFPVTSRNRSTCQWFCDDMPDVRDRVLAARRKANPNPVNVRMTISVPDPEAFRQSERRISGQIKRRLAPVLVLCVFAVALATGCGAREHRDNLAEVVNLQAQRDALIADQERQRKEALAQMALEMREQRREIQDARRTIEQVTQEMEASD